MCDLGDLCEKGEFICTKAHKKEDLRLGAAEIYANYLPIGLKANAKSKLFENSPELNSQPRSSHIVITNSSQKTQENTPSSGATMATSSSVHACLGFSVAKNNNTTYAKKGVTPSSSMGNIPAGNIVQS
jgi:hypothetical protein